MNELVIQKLVNVTFLLAFQLEVDMEACLESSRQVVS